MDIVSPSQRSRMMSAIGGKDRLRSSLSDRWRMALGCASDYTIQSYREDPTSCSPDGRWWY